MFRSTSIIVLGLALASSACASAGSKASGSASRRCEPVDSMFLTKGPVYSVCEVEVAARPSTRIGREFTAGAFRPSPGQDCYSAVVDVVVDEVGQPDMSLSRVVRSNNSEFAEIVKRELAASHFSPAMREGKSVRQLFRYEFGLQMTAVMAGATPQGNTRRRIC